MDEFDKGPSVLTTDPYMMAVALGAAAGLVAATYWLKVFRAVDSTGETVKGARSDLSSAALFTAIAMFLMCDGFLLGRLSGRF